LKDGKSIYVSRSESHIPENKLHKDEWKFEELEGFPVPVDISPDVEVNHPKPTDKKEREKGYLQAS